MKQILIIASLCLVALACGGKKASPETLASGKKVYKQNCMLCHGADGKLGANGSKDLTMSAMTLEERKAIIKNGKGKMIGLGSILDDKQIEAVAQFTFELKK